MPVRVADNPLIQHKLGILRSQDATYAEFRAAANDVAMLLLCEAAVKLPGEARLTRGWAGMVPVTAICESRITFVPILRAGLGFMEGALRMLPGAGVSIVGLCRNEQRLEPTEYYVNLVPEIQDRLAIILDPMLATGGSALACIDILKKAGCANICALHLVCAPEGLERVSSAHPEVDIFTAAIDERLNEAGYILPGLGDAGDRLFGTT